MARTKIKNTTLLHMSVAEKHHSGDAKKPFVEHFFWTLVFSTGYTRFCVTFAGCSIPKRSPSSPSSCSGCSGSRRQDVAVVGSYVDLREIHSNIQSANLTVFQSGKCCDSSCLHHSSISQHLTASPPLFSNQDPQKACTLERLGKAKRQRLVKLGTRQKVSHL